MVDYFKVFARSDRQHYQEPLELQDETEEGTVRKKDKVDFGDEHLCGQDSCVGRVHRDAKINAKGGNNRRFRQ